jgi:hypothetical protein
MSYDNSNTGALNVSTDKRSDKSPDFWGNLQVSGEVLEALKSGKRIRLSGWNRSGSRGDFISLKAEVEKPKDQGQRNYQWSEAEKRELSAKQAGAVLATASENHQAALAVPFDDDIPF